MNSWAVSIFGDPCRECGFAWHDDPALWMSTVSSAPRRFGDELAGASGAERHPALGWTVTGYVAHVADNLTIWAERVAGIAAGAPAMVVGYDDQALGRARRYNELALPGVLWRLGRATGDWTTAFAGLDDELTLRHPDRGEITTSEVRQANAHDAHHHLWDITRSLEVHRLRGGHE